MSWKRTTYGATVEESLKVEGLLHDVRVTHRRDAFAVEHWLLLVDGKPPFRRLAAETWHDARAEALLLVLGLLADVRRRVADTLAEYARADQEERTCATS